MKNKWKLIASIIQLVIGALAVLSFIILGLTGENMIRWIVTLILAIAYVVLGIVGIVDYKSER